MTRLTHLLLYSLAVSGASAASSVLDLLPKNFDQIVLKSGKPAFVEFFAPWCGHCKNLAPVWEELAHNHAFAKDKLSIAKVDADVHKDLGKRFGVQGFPTLKWFDGTSDMPVDYNGGRDLESLTAFVTEKTGIKAKSKKAAPSAVEMLTDQTFAKKVGGDKNVFVAFTASWCGHCKNLAPTWEKLADDFSAEPSVLIAKVDATADNAKSTAEDQGVKSYPTIRYFPKGSATPVTYDGGRSQQDFVAFLNDKAGTHRLVGGGLDAQAGTIAALDAILDKFSTTGATLQSISADAVAAAAALRDRYAEYYIKVLEKVQKNRGYAGKELARLEGLVKKGGLAPEKLDDLVSRSNILRKFAALKEAAKEEL